MEKSKWSDESAKAELRGLIEEIKDLKQRQRSCAEHTRWVLRTLQFLEQVFGRDSRFYLSFAHLRWSKQGEFIVGGPGDPEGSFNPQAAIDRLHQRAYLRDLEAARGFLMAALDELERVGIDAVYEARDAGPEPKSQIRVLNLIERQLRKAIRKTPEEEKDVQDILENLLIGAEIPYLREQVSIPFSSKTYKPDFVLDGLDLVIEVKLCGRPRREKDIIAEINDDIAAYSQEYGSQIFVVYDVGQIRDADTFIEPFEKQEGVIVRVIKH
jgi:prolyl oligopeptidase PreP (S9A serine peptidase family)